MRTVVGVLRGGPSSEYDVSLKTGAAVLGSLNPERYEPRDLFVDKAGQWHLYGVGVTPERALRDVDVVFNAMHGEYGEDGQVQTILESFAVPYTGSRPGASALTFNKHLTRQAAHKLGVVVAHALVVDRGDTEALAHKIFRTFPHPAMVKPVVGGSSVGTTLADSFGALKDGLDKAFAIAPQALVEEFIKGREATVGVISNFRGEKNYALMPVEIVPPKGSRFYDYDAKYIADTRLVCPGNFTQEEKRHLATLARLIHEGLGLAHYSRSDFIVGRRGIYFLEVNTLPGLTDHSNIPQALRAVGAKFPDFLDHIIALALQKDV